MPTATRPAVPPIAPDQVLFGLTAGHELGTADRPAHKIGDDIGRPYHREQEDDAPQTRIVCIGTQDDRRDCHHAGVEDAAGDPYASLRQGQRRGASIAHCQDDQQRPCELIGSQRTEAQARPSAAPASRTGRRSDPRHQRVHSHSTTSAAMPQNSGERPAADIGSRRSPTARAPAPKHTRSPSSLRRDAEVRNRFAEIRRPRHGHDPVRATRPPNRRSRRRYSVIAPSSAARSKSGQ